MKYQTAQFLKEHQKLGNLKFNLTEEGIELEHNLSGDDITAIVEAEYGETAQDKNELFLAIIRKLVRMGLDKVKAKHV